MMQSQSSFAIFVFGLIALNAAKVSVWVVVFLAVFLPVLLTPLLLRLTIWRDTKAVSLEDLPRFTPETGFLPTIFNAAKEGAELLFLLIIPSCAVVFAAIRRFRPFRSVDRHSGRYQYHAQCLQHPCRNRFCFYFSRRSLAMAQLKEIAATIAPPLVVGSYILASSGFPLQVIFGQIPLSGAAVPTLPNARP